MYFSQHFLKQVLYHSLVLQLRKQRQGWVESLAQCYTNSKRQWNFPPMKAILYTAFPNTVATSHM